MASSLLSLIFISVLVCAFAVIPDQDWGYVNVRPSAHMFWWLYGKQDSSQRDTTPLVVWLQGGPGASSTGFGNFQEIGPLDTDLKPRPINWVQSANVLFIDSPVGTGYSYVDDPAAYVTTDQAIGVDLVTLLKTFLTKYPVFKTSPFWIFCESYGGKSTTSFGVELYKAIQKGEIQANFQGVALGDSWISPMSFVATWADYLLATSEIDASGWLQINQSAEQTQQAVNSGQWEQATNLWGQTENVVSQVSAGVSFYNILDRSGDQLKRNSRPHSSRWSKHLQVYATGDLDALMNGPIKQKLGIPANVSWGAQSGDVFNALSGAFMKPIIDGVDFLLGNGVQVVIYSGNLDLICCTPGTTQWMDQLKWAGYPQFKASTRQANSVGGNVVSFSKQFKNLQFWTILAAGHMVPSDQPAAAQAMLQQVIYGSTKGPNPIDLN